MKKTAIVGQCGEGPQYTTGQAVKTRCFAQWMTGRFGADQVEIVNTYGWKKHPVRLFALLIGAMRRCSNIMIFPAQHGVKVFPLAVSMLNRLFRRCTFFVVIGGWLAGWLKDHPVHLRAVASFDGVCAETESLAEELRAAGVKNAWCLPNCRAYSEAEERHFFGDRPLKVCTYSRVTESKGISDAVEICRRANALLGEKTFELEVYGVVAPEYKETFEALCAREADEMRYCGVKNADEAETVLKEQFALLFPTYYEGECFAGTVLDAFVSGTPIIANDWKYNREVIRDGENGFLYPYRNTDAAAEKLVLLYRDKELYKRIQAGCRESALRYDTDAVLEKLVREMA